MSSVEISEPGTPELMPRSSSKKHLDTDEASIIKALTDYQGGLALLLMRVKGTLTSAKEISHFLKKRAAIEEEYAKNILKLCSQSYKTEGKGGSHHSVWCDLVKFHEQLAQQSIAQANQIQELAENMAVLAKNTERSRKQLKEASIKQQKEVQDAESALEKAYAKYSSSSEDWEKAQQFEMQQAEKSHDKKSKQTFGGRLAALTSSMPKFQKSEEDARAKAAASNETYKNQLQTTNDIRSAYFQQSLPRSIVELKATNDDCDQGILKHLTGYCQVLEAHIHQQLAAIDKDGPLKLISNINIKTDFDKMVFAHMSNRQLIDKSDHQYMGYMNKIDVNVSPAQQSISSPILEVSRVGFGSTLVEMMESSPDENPIPIIVTKCVEYIEAHGLDTVGLYRISGAGSQVQKIRSSLSTDPECKLEDVCNDVNAVASVLKTFFRELVDPLFPRDLYKQFLDAARLDDASNRLVQIHELINSLHDANYATLRFLAGHLVKVKAMEAKNKMGIANLAIVWGPTLMDSMDNQPDQNELRLQTMVVEVVLEHYQDIFDAE